MTTKQEIAATAESWEGTPFHHQGRAKGVGVDCIGLIVGICKDLDLKSGNHDPVNGRHISLHEYDDPSYSANPNPTQLFKTLNVFCDPISPDELDVGDVILFTMDRWPQHVGIVTSITAQGTFFIHASQPVGKTILSRYDKRWKKLTAGQFRFPEAAFEGIK